MSDVSAYRRDTHLYFMEIQVPFLILSIEYITS